MNSTLEYLLSIVKQKADLHTPPGVLLNPENVILMLLQKYEEAVSRIHDLERQLQNPSSSHPSSDFPVMDNEEEPTTCQDKIIQVLKKTQNKPLSVEQLKGLVEKEYNSDYAISSYYNRIANMKKIGIVQHAKRGRYILSSKFFP